ncbi:MAG TPA: hypothetical protein DGT21_25195 [Armatimonadetes bacterium]|jgi:hypothetical protein|nr:hypothetical protein [Armatimonadota bacterium]
MSQRARRALLIATVVTIFIGALLTSRARGPWSTDAAADDNAQAGPAAGPLGNIQYDPFVSRTIDWLRVLRDHDVEDEIHAAERAAWDADFARAVRLYNDALGQVEDEQDVALFIQACLVAEYAMADDRQAVLQVAGAALPRAEQVARGGARIEQPLLILSCMLIVDPIVLWGDGTRAEELTVAAQVAEHAASSARELRILVEQWAREHSAPQAGNSVDELHDWASRSDALAARARARLGRRAEAIPTLRDVVDDADRDTALGFGLYCLGVTLVETGAREEAQDALTRGLVAIDAVLASFGERCPREYVWMRDDTERLRADLDPARRVAWFCRLWQDNRLEEMPEFGTGGTAPRGAFLDAAREAAASGDLAGLVGFGAPEAISGAQDDRAKVSIELSFGRDTPPLLVTGDTLFSLSRTEGGWRIVDAAPAGMGAEQ